jgi:acetoacetyl-CoA synthetase
MNAEPEILWQPTEASVADSVMGQYVEWLREHHGVVVNGYEELHRWSVADIGAFWSTFSDFAGVIFHDRAETVVTFDGVEHATWFAGSTLNFAEHCLQGPAEETVLVSHSEVSERRALTRGELVDGVARVRVGLESLGVRTGDRVAAILPSGPEAVMTLLACASMGAVYSSCAPEFGVRNVVDKFSQIEPVVLVAVDGYRYRGRDEDRLDAVAEIRALLPSLRATVLLPYLDPAATLQGALAWADLVAEAAQVRFDAVPFDHPLYILYSSGTTGRPKAIVHGHGGVVLESLKWQHLQDDLQSGDRFLWFSSTGWMAWNLGVSALMTGASVVMLDGDPMYPNLEHYWRTVAEERVTYLGLSPAFLVACRKGNLVPKDIADLSALRTIVSGGSPLPADGFRWVYENIGRDLYLTSSSGGTDVASSFVGGTRMKPVYAGEIACRFLGTAATAYDFMGNELVGQQGELVITRPMPSMPLRLWGDEGGARLHETYFERFPGVWCHGDWVTFTERGTAIVSGRSDATLNRGGVRIGTSEFYSVVDQVEGVSDSLVVHLEGDDGGFGQLILFLVLAPERQLDDGLLAEIRTRLRSESSPRHVPDVVHVVPTVPRTHSAKKMEIPVKRLLQGVPAEDVVAQSALLQPGSLDWYVDFVQAHDPDTSTQAGSAHV